MAFGEKCYCCGKVYPRDDLFYCEECLMKLSKAFETGEGVVFNPKHYDHCMMRMGNNMAITYRMFAYRPKKSAPSAFTVNGGELF